MSFTPFQPSDPFSREAFNTLFQTIFDTTDGLAAGAVKIQTGSYLGSGTYGADNQNRLTFDFNPILVVVGQVDNRYMQFFLRGCSAGRGGGSGSGFSDWSTAIWGEKTLSWYSTYNLENQLNNAGKVHQYFAIG